MGWKFDIDVKQVVDAPQQVLWDRVSNHDGTADWVKRWVKRVKVHTPGHRRSERCRRDSGAESHRLARNEGASGSVRATAQVPIFADLRVTAGHEPSWRSERYPT